MSIDSVRSAGGRAGRRRAFTVRGSACVLATMLLAGTGAASRATESSAELVEWLDRMVRASRSLNYEGTFVYSNGATVRSMRIIHQASPGGVRERLVALSGVAREVIRDPDKVTCILPDSKSVLVTKSHSSAAIAPSLFNPDLAGTGNDLGRHYRFDLSGRARVTGRDTRVIRVVPNDAHRYGYRLAVDESTGLLLKSELLSADGVSLEQIVYTTLNTPESIPDSLLEPEISGSGFRVVTTESSAGARSGSVDEAWRIGWLPDGFRPSDAASHDVSPSSGVVSHQIFSDGLASLSIFVEPLADAAEPLDGASSMGAVSAFGRMVDHHQITVVGEVPPETVRRVAQAVSRKQ